MLKLEGIIPSTMKTGGDEIPSMPPVAPPMVITYRHLGALGLTKRHELIMSVKLVLSYSPTALTSLKLTMRNYSVHTLSEYQAVKIESLQKLLISIFISRLYHVRFSRCWQQRRSFLSSDC